MAAPSSTVHLSGGDIPVPFTFADGSIAGVGMAGKLFLPIIQLPNKHIHAIGPLQPTLEKAALAVAQFVLSNIKQ